MTVETRKRMTSDKNPMCVQHYAYQMAASQEISSFQLGFRWTKLAQSIEASLRVKG